MAVNSVLSSNDHAVLSKLFDPESVPDNTGVMIDASLPSDPNIPDPHMYLVIQKEEKSIIQTIEAVLRDPEALPSSKHQAFKQAYTDLSDLIETHPTSASLRNNRTQLFRLQYGDNVLVYDVKMDVSSELWTLATTALSDLDEAIRLLSPVTPHSAVSPFQSRVLAQAYTQRGALFHAAVKLLTIYYEGSESSPTAMIRVVSLKDWDLHDFEAAASKDFFMGGRYGNEIGKSLAVHTNPTAKLCGQMVQEAMKREYTSANIIPPPS